MAISETNNKIVRSNFIEYMPTAVNVIKVSPATKKQEMAIGKENGNIEIWELNGKWTCRYIYRSINNRGIEGLTWVGSKYNPDNTRLFSISGDGVIYEWDREKMIPKWAHDSYGGVVYTMEVSHDENYLAVGCIDGTIRIFSLDGDKLEYLKAFNRTTDTPLSLSWSPDDKYIVSGSNKSMIRIWDFATGHAIDKIDVSPNINTKITTRSSNVKESSMVKSDEEKDLNGIDIMISSIKWINENNIVTGDSNGNTTFWDAKTATLVKQFKLHDGPILTLESDYTGTYVFSSGVDSLIQRFVYLPDEYTWIQSGYRRAHLCDIRTLTIMNYNSDGDDYDHNNEKQRLIAAGVDGVISIHHIQRFVNCKETKLLPLPDQSIIQYNHKNGLLFARINNILQIWKIPELKSKKNLSMECQIVYPEDTWIVGIVVSEDGSLLALLFSSCIKLFFKKKNGKWSIGPVISKISCRFLVFNTNNSKIFFVTGMNDLWIADVGKKNIVPIPININLMDKEELIVDLIMSRSRLLTIIGERNVYLLDETNSQIENIDINDNHDILPDIFFPTVTRFPNNNGFWDNDNNELIVLSIDNEICTYDINTKKPTELSMKYSEDIYNALKKEKKIQGLCKGQDSNIYLWTKQHLYLLDFSGRRSPDLQHEIDENQVELLIGEKEKKKQDKLNLYKNTRFSWILYFTNVSEEKDNWLIIERPWASIANNLPRKSGRYKYGGRN